MYKAAVLLNGVFLCGSFLLTIFCGKKLFRDLNRWNLILFSWCVNVFSSMILYAQTTLAENLIVFVFLLGTALYFHFLEKPGYLRACLTGLAFGYLYSIHMRTLTVLVALAFCDSCFQTEEGILAIYSYTGADHRCMCICGKPDQGNPCRECISFECICQHE